MDLVLHISKLLFSNNILVIPNLGVFEVSIQEAYIHPVSNDFTPKYKKIKFTKNFEATDSVLSKSIIDGNSDKIIEAFVIDVKNSLENGKSFNFKNIGVLKMHSSGTIIFEQDLSFNYEKSFFGLEAFEGQLIKKEEDKKIVVLNAEEDKPKRRLLWLWFSVLTVAVLVVLFMIFKDNFVSDNSQPIVIKDTTVNTKLHNDLVDNDVFIDTNMLDSVEDSTLVNSEIDSSSVDVSNVNVKEQADTQLVALVDKTTIEPKTKKKYYVIAACFRSESKAREYLQEIKQKGYNDASIEGKTAGGLIRVCYAGFDKRYKAKKFLEETSAKEAKNLWIQRIR